MKKIALGSDHAGFRLKEVIKQHLLAAGYEIVDCGTDSEEPVDYPDHVRPAAAHVADGSCDGGVIFGGSGNGEAMTANKLTGIRCAVCWNVWSATMARQHNDANVISLGARAVSDEEAVAIVDAWLSAEFEAGRHVRRLAKMAEPHRR